MNHLNISIFFIHTFFYYWSLDFFFSTLNTRCSKIWCSSGVTKPSCSYICNIARGRWAKRWDSVTLSNKSMMIRNLSLWIVGFYLILQLFLISKCPQMLLLMALDEHNYLHYEPSGSRGLDGCWGISLEHKSKTTAPPSPAIPKVIRIYPLERKNPGLILTVVQPCHSRQTNAADGGKT